MLTNTSRSNCKASSHIRQECPFKSEMVPCHTSAILQPQRSLITPPSRQNVMQRDIQPSFQPDCFRVTFYGLREQALFLYFFWIRPLCQWRVHMTPRKSFRRVVSTIMACLPIAFKQRSALVIKSLEGFTSLSQCHCEQQGRGGMDYGVTLGLLVWWFIQGVSSLPLRNDV